MSQNRSAAKALQFMSLVGRLKHVKRTGWVLRQVPEPEDVSGHMYRMAVMSMMLTDIPNLNRDKVIKMTLVHDIAECIVGDLTPSHPISKEEKHRQEREAMDQLTNLIAADVATEIQQLWEEYESQETLESVVVKDLDRFDMILQAHEYEQAEPDRVQFLQEFFDSTEGKFRTPHIREWVDELHRERKSCVLKPSSNSENSS